MKNAFEKVDEHSKTINELFNFIFLMRLSKKNEIFDEFLTRFNSHMIELIFDDAFKIIQLKRIMIEKLNYDIKHLIRCINFKIFCDEVRKIAKLNNQMNERKRDEIIKTIIFETRDIDKIVARIDRIIERFKRFITLIERLSTHIQAKLAKEEKCHKCLKSSHKRNNSNAFCKNESTIIKEQIITQLIVLSIE